MLVTCADYLAFTVHAVQSNMGDEGFSCASRYERSDWSCGIMAQFLRHSICLHHLHAIF
jgi:hypothetical protein